MKLILMGPPGSGKGTQAERLSAALKVPAVSTGNILRESVAAGTELGRAARSYMDEGKLVPDGVIIGMIRDRLSRPDTAGGFLLDGFPRTVAQAEALDAMGVGIDRAVSLEVDDAEIERRMACRRVCGTCGASYHTEHKPPAKAGVCDACGNPVVLRGDDAPETVRARLAVYHEQTEPVKGYYMTRGRLTAVPAIGDIAEIGDRILLLLGLSAGSARPV